MPNEPTTSHGVMEGQGAYNKYAKLPAGGAALALPLLERATSDVALATDDQPLVIADYRRRRGKIRWFRCRSHSEFCATAWARLAQFSCSTLTSHRTTSIRSSKY